ncbi:3'-5' exonuclease-like [Corylus avellana]|uniref:3'-5' exonuclease-like n=1 Tax=Corylus avellana TaxID=13451 RepID=UPI00286C136F|nr:3'-5' exonuclease-like [Corylus avellana]
MSAFETNATTTKYNVSFAGKTIETIVTDKGSDIDEWLHLILSLYAGAPTVVGLDTEWSPSKKAATLQLCIDDKCLIVQLIYMDNIPRSLKSFLMDSNFTLVGIEVAQDIAKLRDEYKIECEKSADIGKVAKSQWPGRFRGPSLKELALEVVGLYMRKPKDICMSNWGVRMLSEEQIEYAGIDAYASFRIGCKLLMEDQ